MTPQLKAKWVAALRSGKFKQTKHWLHKISKSRHHSYCCLGVLCEVAGIKGKKLAFPKYGKVVNYGGGTSLLGRDQLETVQLDSSLQDYFASMNDGSLGFHKFSFLEIADYIEAHDLTWK